MRNTNYEADFTYLCLYLFCYPACDVKDSHELTLNWEWRKYHMIRWECSRNSRLGITIFPSRNTSYTPSLPPPVLYSFPVRH